ncbi:MAG: XRE family transcriptional regulator [Acidaminococcaceae bacterium]
METKRTATFGDRLKELRTKLSLTQAQFGKLLGLSMSTISLYEANKRFPDQEILKQISVAGSISLDYLILGHYHFFPTPTAEISYLNTTSTTIFPRVLTSQELPAALEQVGDTFALLVEEVAMTPRIAPGDIAIVHAQKKLDSGNIGLFLIAEHKITIKQAIYHATGINLVAFNTNLQQPQFYTYQEIACLPIKILGKIIEIRSKLS